MLQKHTLCMYNGEVNYKNLLSFDCLSWFTSELWCSAPIVYYRGLHQIKTNTLHRWSSRFFHLCEIRLPLHHSLVWTYFIAWTRRQSLMSTLVVHVLVCGARTIIVAQVLTDQNWHQTIHAKLMLKDQWTMQTLWFRYLNQRFLRNRYIHSQAACFSWFAPERVDLVLLVSTWITIDFPKRKKRKYLLDVNVMKLTGYMRGT